MNAFDYKEPQEATGYGVSGGYELGYDDDDEEEDDEEEEDDDDDDDDDDDEGKQDGDGGVYEGGGNSEYGEVDEGNYGDDNDEKNDEENAGWVAAENVILRELAAAFPDRDAATGKRIQASKRFGAMKQALALRGITRGKNEIKAQLKRLIAEEDEDEDEDEDDHDSRINDVHDDGKHFTPNTQEECMQMIVDLVMMKELLPKVADLAAGGRIASRQVGGGKGGGSGGGGQPRGQTGGHVIESKYSAAYSQPKSGVEDRGMTKYVSISNTT